METAINIHGHAIAVGDTAIKTHEEGYTTEVEIIKLFEGRNGVLYAECKKGRTKAFFDIDSLSPVPKPNKK
jgi:hypothetical protein